MSTVDLIHIENILGQPTDLLDFDRNELYVSGAESGIANFGNAALKASVYLFKLALFGGLSVFLAMLIFCFWSAPEHIDPGII